MMCNYPILDPVNINAFTKFGEILLIFSQILSRNKMMMDGRNDGMTDGMMDNRNPE